MIIGSELRLEILLQKTGFDFRINSPVPISIHEWTDDSFMT